MVKAIGFVGLGCCAAAFVSALLAVALPYWETVDNAFGESNTGLWRFCIKVHEVGFGFDNCGDTLDAALTDELKDSLRATRAMVLLGFFCITGALISNGLILFVIKDQKTPGFIGGGLAIAGGLFLMIGMAIYADKIKLDGSDYSAGFAFDILGWIVAWIAAGLIFLSTIMDK